jgi:AcrR family transcriptional regulator
MTAEVVVMNRLGVALASDSAASVLVGGRTKLYHADKLFMLSNVRPVAVMVYNSSSLLQVPWETIVKSFRKELGSVAYDTLEEYAAALIAYLNRGHGMFPEDVQKVMFLHTLGVLFKEIDREVRRDALEKYFADGADDGHKALREAAAPCIERVFEEWDASPDLDGATFPSTTAMSFATRLSGEINRLISESFSYLGAGEVQSLTRLARLVIQKQKMVTDTYSGLVLAGFGEKQFFPVLQSYKVGGVFEGHLKYVLEETLRVDVDHPAVIKPFAQSVTVEPSSMASIRSYTLTSRRRCWRPCWVCLTRSSTVSRVLERSAKKLTGPR